ncbi:MAG: hypothetical protein Salg2KO_07660 [Salibacteraceae bacterium]
MQKIKAILAIVLLLSVVQQGCKNSDKATKSTTEPSVKQAEAIPESSVDQEELKAEAETKPAQAERPAPRYPDSLYFRIDRTPCFGECPIYTVNIYRSGWAYMKGGRFFDYEGDYITKFNEEEMIRIDQMAKNIGYAEMDHVYDAPVTDLPSTTTIVNSEAITHWVYNRMNSPDELRNFEREVETMIKDKQWKPYTKGKKAAPQDAPE